MHLCIWSSHFCGVRVRLKQWHVILVTKIEGRRKLLIIKKFFFFHLLFHFLQLYSWYQILESTFVAYIIAVMAVVSADCRYHIATVKLLSPILITGRVCAMCFIYRPHTALNSGAECVCVCMYGKTKPSLCFSVV